MNHVKLALKRLNDFVEKEKRHILQSNEIARSDRELLIRSYLISFENYT